MMNTSEQTHEIKQATSSGKKIVACLDGAAQSQAVCDYAIWIAQTLSAPLMLLHTIEPAQVPPVADLSGAIGLGASEELLAELTEVEQSRRQLMIKKGNIMLQAAKQRAEAQGIEDVETVQQHGNLAQVLVDLEEQVRVLVMGIRGQDHESDASGLGSQLETVIRSLHTPILVVNTEFSKPNNVMLAYDGSEAADKGLALVASSPLFQALPCHLVHIVDAANAEQDDPILNRAHAQLKASGMETKAVSLAGKMETVLVECQQQQGIDLMVMGAFSHNRLRKLLLGSLTAKMLEKTQKPVLLLR